MASVAERLQALALCLCAEVAKDKPTCFCGVLPGAAIAHDYTSNCEEACGMAWVRMDAAQPVTGIDLVDETVFNCGSDLGFSVEVGIIRCSVLPSDGEAPTDAEQLEMAVQQLTDMATMRTAIACCDVGDLILRAYQPFGPTGGVVGGTWLVSMAESG